MQISMAALDPQQTYALMTQTVIPRPIAWVLTRRPGCDSVDPEDLNLAPFSYFNALCSQPATVMISVGLRPDGSLKDTSANLVEGSPCVIHLPDRQLVQACNLTATPLPPGESEIRHAGLELTEFADFPLPRLREAPLAMAGHAVQTVTIGSKAQQSVILIELSEVFSAEHCVSVQENGRLKVDAWAMDPVARLGPTEYTTLGDRLTLPRPF